MKFFKATFFLFLISFLAGCQYQRNEVCGTQGKKKVSSALPLFIKMPQHVQVFDEVGPLAYQALVSHYHRIGYHLVDSASQGYTLEVVIKKLEPLVKLVSPDVVLLHQTFYVQLEVKLINFENKVVARNLFHSSTVISKPRNPVLESDFLRAAYEKLFIRMASPVERYFRPYMTKE